MPPALSVVVPARNEAARIGATVRSIGAWMRSSGLDGEVIVVDDGSTDPTGSLAREAGALVLVHDQNRGKGAAVRTGMGAATAPLRLFCDADLSTPLEEFGRLRAAIEAGADVAIGSRVGEGAAILRPRRQRRVLLSRTFNTLTRALLPGIGDTQCGFKLFTEAAVARILPRARLDRYAFDVELLVIARAQGLRVAEVPVRWAEADASSLRLGPDGARMLADLARVVRLRAAGGYR